MVLAVLGLVYFIILLTAGGLWHQALQPCVLVLSLVSCIQIFYANKKKRLISQRVFWPLLGLLFFLPLFVVPTSFLPTWMVSDERQFLSSNLETFYQSILSQSVIEPDDFDQKLGLNMWGTLRFYTIVLLFANVVYLIAGLSRREKLYFFYILLFGASSLALINMIDKVAFELEGFAFLYQEMDQYVIPKITAGFRLNNHYGVYLCFFLPFCLNFFWRYWRRGDKSLGILWLAIYLWIFIGVCLAGSRGAYLLAFVTTAAYFLRGRKPVHLFGGIFAAFILVLFFAWTVPENLDNEFDRGINERVRLELYSKVPEIVYDYPWGMGSYAYRFVSTHKVVKDKNQRYKAHHSESTPLQILQEWGIVSFVLWVILMIGCCIVCFEAYKRGKVSRRLMRPSLIALIAAIIHGQYDFPYESPIYTFTVAVILGFLLSKGKKYDDSIDSKGTLYLSRMSIIFPLISFVFCLFLYKETRGEMYRDHYLYCKDKSLQQLVELLHDQPSSWHTWLWVGHRAWKKGYLELAEQAYKNSAIYFPNHAVLWNYLAKVRYLQGKKQAAAQAFKWYYLQLPSYERKDQKKQARAFFKISEEEVEKLFYINLKKADFKRESLLKI